MNQIPIFVLCVYSILNSLFSRLLLSTFMLGVRKSASYFIFSLHFPLNIAFCATYDQFAFSHLYLMSCKTCFLFAL